MYSGLHSFSSFYQRVLGCQRVKSAHQAHGRYLMIHLCCQWPQQWRVSWGEEMVSKQSYEFRISTSHLGLCPEKEQYPVRESNTHIHTVPSGFSVSGLWLISQNSARRAEKFLFLCVFGCGGKLTCSERLSQQQETKQRTAMNCWQK